MVNKTCLNFKNLFKLVVMTLLLPLFLFFSTKTHLHAMMMEMEAPFSLEEESLLVDKPYQDDGQLPYWTPQRPSYENKDLLMKIMMIGNLHPA
ncbi:hypothetical protein [Candidatus Phytoplasma pruni]|uniref:Uncharacterized protein n=1 Tax=Candidatus Phytoplasma pruni TaxID=479893 RepID=A0A851HJB4_9MOLU|nr:hypothetical protein [Candidatus Phytoplasma pruni]NWN45923.1 hypothetical protein [Candidatus Phytoplasma pruni]